MTDGPFAETGRWRSLRLIFIDEAADGRGSPHRRGIPMARYVSSAASNWTSASRPAPSACRGFSPASRPDEGLGQVLEAVDDVFLHLQLGPRRPSPAGRPAPASFRSAKSIDHEAPQVRRLTTMRPGTPRAAAAGRRRIARARRSRRCGRARSCANRQASKTSPPVLSKEHVDASRHGAQLSAFELQLL